VTAIAPPSIAPKVAAGHDLLSTKRARSLEPSACESYAEERDLHAARGMRRILSLVAATSLCVLLSAAAEAGPFLLRVCDDAACDGGNDVMVASAVDIVGFQYLGFGEPPFPGWSFISVVGLSSDLLGEVAAPWVRLTFEVRGRGPDATELFLSISDTDFTYEGDVHTGLSGFVIPPTPIAAAAYAGPSNLPFDTSVLLEPVPARNRVGADGTPYSLTLSVNIGYAAGGSIRTEGTLEVVPEPASLALMGTGLAAVVLARRRRAPLR
jgi:hypothetical protein